MEPRLTMITLGVADLARATAFYEKVVGWKRADGPPTIAFFDLGGLVFSLYPHEELAKDMKVEAAQPSAYRGFALAYNARSKDEVNAIFARLKSGGADIVKAPEDAFWGGYSGYFADPDGHRWEVAYNPFWTVRADGRVVMAQNA